jgi:hypothetical protein
MALAQPEAGEDVFGQPDPGRAQQHVMVCHRVLIAGGALLAVALVALATAGLIVQASVGCGACPAMVPYAEAHAAGPHASLRCATCHASDSPAAVMAEGMRAVGWHVGALARRIPQPVILSDSSCRACHEQLLKDVAVSGGIAVRHADFLEQPCGDCHAGVGHRLPSHRHYTSVSMADCTVCHTDADRDAAGCDRCHVGDMGRDAPASGIPPTHGPGWLATHGAEATETCKQCHAQRSCFDCHGVVVPHPDEWPVAHGTFAKDSARSSCRLCHEAAWCDGCHGLEMPHPTAFVSRHSQIARQSRSEACRGCHAAERCDACHFASSHPETAGVDIGHRW